MKRRDLLLSAIAVLAPWPARAEGLAPATVPKAAATPLAPAPDTGAVPHPILSLTRDTLSEDPVSGRLTVPASALPPPATGLPVIDPGDGSPEAARLGGLYARGKAAGLAGVIYDNRDRGHSAIPATRFPQMTLARYGPALRARNLDYGLAGAFRFPAITLGNSSTALVSGPDWRSQARLAMTMEGAPARAAGDYAANALYVYPEHRDHDAFDYYPAAWPYTVTSQGSSGSDEPFLRELGMILAAFPPDTRARMAAQGLVAPTVQWVMRRTQMGLRAPADYLSGRAHPSAFAKDALNPPAAVALAASLAPGAIPPVPVLRVLREDFQPRAGLAGLNERLFDTPSAVARLWRAPAGRREIVLSGAETVDPAGRALRFHWVLLRGDPARVKIVPEGAAGNRVRITLDWQDPAPAPAGFGVTGPGPLSSRIDIGLFAEALEDTAGDAAGKGGQTGASHLSAPAFLSITLGPEKRLYETGLSGAPRLLSIDYDAALRGAAYDPMLFWWAPWRDTLHYDTAGRMTGWTRTATRPSSAAARAAGDYGADGTRGGQPVRYALTPLTDPQGRRLTIAG